MDGMADVCDPRFPIIATTFRVTEHWQTGPMTRNLTWQSELMPEMFVEISPSLAKAKGIRDGDWVEISSQRGAIKAKACVTKRIRPIMVDGKPCDVVGLPIHFGFIGLTRKSQPANTLTPSVGDASVNTPEYKAFLVDVRKTTPPAQATV